MIYLPKGLLVEIRPSGLVQKWNMDIHCLILVVMDKLVDTPPDT